ncbi:hypothetical protein [Paenibacillus faecalis]|nr:hypothetical protein [Paenibacillus faecalis]
MVVGLQALVAGIKKDICKNIKALPELKNPPQGMSLFQADELLYLIECFF